MPEQNVLLASSSPYRRVLLAKLAIDFVTASPDIDETPVLGEQPDALAIRLAVAKAHALKDQFPNHLIIGSDQVAVCQGQQLHKPGNRENTIQQLKCASGKQMDFYTGVCVLNSQTMQYISDLDRCTVYFKQLTDAQIENYVDIDQAFFCAGGFKAESLAVALFERIDSQDPNTLIGLPLIKLVNMLQSFGLSII